MQAKSLPCCLADKQSDVLLMPLLGMWTMGGGGEAFLSRALHSALRGVHGIAVPRS